MSWYEILIVVAAVCFVAGVVVWRIVRKVQGKSGCECGGVCEHCGGCPACHASRKDNSDHSVQSP